MNSEERLIDLEQKISFQDFTLLQLQEAYHEQQLTIAKLEKTVKDLMDRFNDASSGSLPVGPGNEKPPHY